MDTWGRRSRVDGCRDWSATAVAKDAKEPPCRQVPEEVRTDPPFPGSVPCRPPILDFHPPELETVHFCCFKPPSFQIAKTVWRRQYGGTRKKPGWSPSSFEDPTPPGAAPTRVGLPSNPRPGEACAAAFPHPL